MTTTIYTVGLGKTYKSINAAIAAVAAGLPGNDLTGTGLHRIEVYPEDPAFPYVGHIDGIWLLINASAADYIEIVSMVNHNGTPGAGIVLDVGDIAYADHTLLLDYTKFHGFEMVCSAYRAALANNVITILRTHVQVYDCLIHDIDLAGQTVKAIAVSQYGGRVFNNAIWNIGLASANGYGIDISAHGQAGAEQICGNNTVYNCKTVLIRGNNRNRIKLHNNYAGRAVGVSGTDYTGFGSNPDGSNSYNISSDATADDWGGVGQLINKPTLNQFVTPGSDFHILFGSDCRRAGLPGFDMSAYYTTDWEGQTRLPAITGYNTGADEYGTATHTVTFNTDGTPGASISGVNPQTVSHGGNCTPVEAIPPIGYHFVKWTLGGVDYSIDNPLTVTNVISDMTITANFAIDTHTVSFSTGGLIGSSLIGITPQVIPYGGDCSAVEAVPPISHFFAAWQIGGFDYSMDNPITVQNVIDDMALTARWEKKQFHLHFETDGTPGSSLIGDVDQMVYYGDDSTPVEAVAPIGFHFSHWLVNGTPYSIDNPITIPSVTHAMDLIAVFAENWDVIFQTDGTIGAVITGDNPQSIPDGGDCTQVSVSVPVGYQFLGWFVLGVLYDISNPITVLNVTTDMILIARFEITKHQVTFQIDGTPGASISGPAIQNVDYGQNTIPVSAVAPPGFFFDYWELVGSGPYGTDNPFTVINVIEPMDFIAHFLEGVRACINNECVIAPGPGPNLGYPEFAGQITGTIQTYRGSQTAKKLPSKIGIGI